MRGLTSAALCRAAERRYVRRTTKQNPNPDEMKLAIVAYGCLIKQPDEIGGFETQSAYVVVSDADEIYRRAKIAGAEIVIEIKDEDYGGRVFSCRDLEGHLWNIGSYDPW